MHLKLLFALILIICTSIDVHALITPDVIPTQIFKVYDQNILAINRGLEDGIFKGSHIKLTSRDGFIARGISLKSNMTISYVKIYRVVNPELVSKDTLYDLKDMHQSEIPDDLKYLKSASLPYNLKEIRPSELGKQLKLQQKRIAKFDLPTSIKKAKAKEPSEAENFVRKNFSYSKFKEDISSLNLELFVSPLQNQTLNGQQNLNYGLAINNRGDKFQYQLKHTVFESTLVDPYTDNELSSKRELTSFNFDVNKITDHMTYFVWAGREVNRTGEFYNPKQRLNYGLFGLKYHFVEEKDLEPGEYGFYTVDFSYIPLFETYTYEFDPDLSDNQFAKTTETDRYLRHALRLRAHMRISAKNHLKLNGWWRPYQNINSGAFDWENNLTDMSFIFSSELDENFSFNLSVQYTYDILQRRNYNIDPQNIINSFTLNYKVPLQF
jgi:hypothetical protein